MRAAYFTPKVFAIFGLLLFTIAGYAQEYSAGINTETPNTNAVLHLVAPNGDQGLLIPSLTTTERSGMGLTAADNGMLVFDSDLNLFYYWLNPSWIALSTSDSDNQTLSIAGTNLTISNGNTIDIGTAETDPTVPATIKDGIDWTEISGIPADFADNTDDGIASVLSDATINGDGIGTPLSVNTGTTANQLVQLNASGQLPAVDGSNLTNLNAGALTGVLPAIDGSNLTGVTSAVITDGTTITGDGSATQLAVGTLPAGQVSGLATIATTGSFGDLTLVPVGLADGDDVGLTTVTSADIVDNEIANIDINATANIAATKLQTTVMVEGENVSLLNNDAGYMAAGTYDPNTIAGDVFDFDTHPTVTVPAAGNVLTWTGTTWDAQPSTGLTLPYTQSVANAADLFYLTNTGLGGAGAFEISNIANASNALKATTNGVAAAIQASQGGTAGSGIDISVTGATNTSPGILVSHSGAGAGLNLSLSNATNPDAGLSVNHAGLGPGIEITTTTGPPMFITGGNAGEVLTSDALGNITLQPGGLALPYSNSGTDAGPLFSISNAGVGSAAFFENTGGGTAVRLGGNILFNEGSGRIIGVQQNTVGAGDNLTVAAADGVAAGPANGGNLTLRSGAGTGTGGNGGNIEILPGPGSGGGFTGGVFVNGITRFGNPGVGFGGMIELEDDAGTNSVGIEADPITASYIITLPPAQGAGALTNDGAGVLSWAAGSSAFTLDGNNNLTAITGATPPGVENFLVGVNTGNSLIVGGDHNILIGNGAGQSITSGSTNIVIGLNAGGPGLTSEDGNVIIGESATVNAGFPNVVVGQGASSSGINAVALGIGASVGAAVTGSMALGTGSNATGDNSIAIGFNTNAPQDNSAIIGDATVPGFFVGVGTQTPTAKLSVENGNATGQGIAINMLAASANPDQALLIAQNADGMGADIRITNSVSAATAMAVSTQGTGSVGVFQINNTGNTTPSVIASTNGTGNALLVDHIGTTAGDALSVNHSAPAGRGIIVDMNGVGDQGLFIGGTNPASSSIETDGTVLFRKNFITPTFAYDVGGSGPVLPNSHRLLRITNLPDIQIDEISVAGASDGQEILLVVEAAGTNFNVTSVGTGAVNIRLDNDNTFTMRTGSSLHLVYIEPLNQWVEIGRSF